MKFMKHVFLKYFVIEESYLLPILFFKDGGASSNPCDETYAGSKPFSEIEMKSMSEYIGSIKDKIFAYIAFHSYSQLLMFPYGHTTEHLDNYNETVRI